MPHSNHYLIVSPAPSSAPRNVHVTIVSSTIARLSWDAPRQADQNGIIRQYYINVTEVNKVTVGHFW